MYVTWQERERHRLALAYLARAKERAPILNQIRKAEREKKRKQEEADAKLAALDEQDETQSQGGKSHTSSFDPQRLAQPKTISYDRIHTTIVKLQ